MFSVDIMRPFCVFRFVPFVYLSLFISDDVNVIATWHASLHYAGKTPRIIYPGFREFPTVLDRI